MIPAHIGPCEFGRLGKLIAVRCPHEFDQVALLLSVAVLPSCGPSDKVGYDVLRSLIR